MDVLLLDERVRVVLRELPRFLSTAIPLEDKLDELCATSVEVLDLTSAAVVLLDDGHAQHAQVGVPEPVMTWLLDRAQMRQVMRDRDIVPLHEHGLPGVLVALRHGVHAFGVLYADRPSYAVLVEDDELMLKLFVDAVGPAIHHGIRMLSSERAERWGAASVALTERLLADEQADPYEVVADVVSELGEADAVGVIVPEGEGFLVHQARGLGLDALVGTVLRREDILAGDQVDFRHGLIADGRRQPSAWLARHHPEIELGPGIAVPLLTGTRMLGILFLVRSPHGPVFSDAALHTAETFGVNAAVSVEWHAARRTQDELRTLQERNRIARDLHDNVVQRLFATGLYLQQAGRTLDGEAKERVESAMQSVDQTIRQIRNTILVLRSTEADRLGQLVGEIVAETGVLLGYQPTVELSPEAARISGPLAADLALCVREAFSNVVQHAQATSVQLRGELQGATLVLSVTDDGIGIPPDVRPAGGGLENLQERARAHGGTFTHTSDPGTGTTLTWRMPLRGQ